MNQEIEVKYHVPDSLRSSLLLHPLLKQVQCGSARDEDLLSIYFDTPDLHLRKQKVALRVRRTPTGYVQTVKGETISHEGFTTRPELEWDLDSAELDLQRLGDTPFAWVVARPELRPVFQTQFQRTILDLVLEAGTQVECALDWGTILAGSLIEPICELELELKGGSVECLSAFCQRVRSEIGLQPGDESKAARGYALYQRSRNS